MLSSIEPFSPWFSVPKEVFTNKKLGNRCSEPWSARSRSCEHTWTPLYDPTYQGIIAYILLFHCALWNVLGSLIHHHPRTQAEIRLRISRPAQVLRKPSLLSLAYLRLRADAFLQSKPKRPCFVLREGVTASDCIEVVDAGGELLIFDALILEFNLDLQIEPLREMVYLRERVADCQMNSRCDSSLDASAFVPASTRCTYLPMKEKPLGGGLLREGHIRPRRLITRNQRVATKMQLKC